MSRLQEKEKILVVDDSAATVEVLFRNLSSRGYQVLSASEVSEAIDFLEADHVDLVITDLKMPGSSGLQLVKYIRHNHVDTEVMMITGYATVEGAVEAVKSGAEEYLSKPFTDEELFTAVERALDKLQLARAARHKALATPKAPHGIIGESEVMKTVYRAVSKAARISATVLITGESGTGKELVARAIHYGGKRAGYSFITVNCGAIPENLLESELFGHVKGAFTGAIETRTGFFQNADRGTIFLDEVSEMSLAMQVKLLRAIQEKEICMVGSTKSLDVDVRILAATNKDLSALVDKSLFRADLYYRLNVIPISLPPLRERGDDLILLIRSFARRYAEEAERQVPNFTEEALQVLRSYHWPGNVRELQNVINRLVVMIDGNTIRVPDLPELMRATVPRKPNFRRTLAEMEHDYVRMVLESVGGNKTRAAQILGIDRKTLRSKLREK